MRQAKQSSAHLTGHHVDSIASDIGFTCCDTQHKNLPVDPNSMLALKIINQK
jgi:hypothetical protein